MLRTVSRRARPQGRVWLRSRFKMRWEALHMGDGLVVVAGAGGFIGGWLVDALVEEGREVRAVDVKPIERWQQLSPEAENVVLDLRRADACDFALEDARQVYNLAA